MWKRIVLKLLYTNIIIYIDRIFWKWGCPSPMLSGLKGNKEFFTWGYLYEKLRMRLSYNLMKDPIKEKNLQANSSHQTIKCIFNVIQGISGHSSQSRKIFSYHFGSWNTLLRSQSQKIIIKKLNFNFGVMVMIRSYLNFGKLHFELRILRK